MADITLVSECFVRPKHEVVDATKQSYYNHLSPIEVGMITIDPIQKGLLFSLDTKPSTQDRTNVVSHLLRKLKHSLSVALVHFYPLAGRLATTRYPDEHACSIYVDCNKGPGARLIHATALDVTVSDVLRSGDVPKIVLSMFELGEITVNYDGHTRALLSIQVTELYDGVFIGFSMNHSVVDGTSFIHVVSMLSEIFRSYENKNVGENGTTKISRVPVFNYKPWVDIGVDKKDLSIVKLPYLEPEEFIVRGYNEKMSVSLRERIFHFSSTTMASLKAKANQDCGTHNVVSSFQALSALVWRSITRARNVPSDQLTSCSVLMNARSRLGPPPLNDDYFGNFIWGTKTDCNVGELLSHDLGWVAMKLREDLVAQEGEKILGFYKSFAESPMVAQRGVESVFHGPNKVIMGGSARFDMYGPEFGLGRGLGTRMGFGNKEDGKVTANPGFEGGGSVDLEICLEPHFMVALVANSEFMSFVSLN